MNFLHLVSAGEHSNSRMCGYFKHLYVYSLV